MLLREQSWAHVEQQAAQIDASRISTTVASVAEGYERRTVQAVSKTSKVRSNDDEGVKLDDKGNT